MFDSTSWSCLVGEWRDWHTQRIESLQRIPEQEPWISGCILLLAIMHHVWFINAISLNTELQCSMIDSKFAGWICATIWRDQNSIQVAMVPQTSQALPCSPSPHRSTHLLNRFYFNPFGDSHDLLRHAGRCCRSQLAGDRRQDPCSLALV